MLRIGLAHPEHQVNYEVRTSRGGHQLAAYEMDSESDKRLTGVAVQDCNRDGDRKSNIRMLTGTIKADCRLETAAGGTLRCFHVGC